MGVTAALFGPEYGQVTARVDRTLRRIESQAAEATSAPVTTLLAATVSEMRHAWDAALVELSQRSANVAAVKGDLRLTADARNTAVLVEVAHARSAADKTRAELDRLTERALTRLRAMGTPPRPTGDDLVIEAQIAAVKTDAKMLFDPYERGELLQVIADELAGRIDTGDTVGAYVLGGDWTETYLRSRRADLELTTWRMRDRPAVLAAHTVNDDAGDAARALGVVDGADGFPGLLVSMSALLRHAIARIEATPAAA